MKINKIIKVFLVFIAIFSSINLVSYAWDFYYCSSQTVDGFLCSANFNNLCVKTPVSVTANCYKFCEDSSQINCSDGGCKYAQDMVPVNAYNECVQLYDPQGDPVGCQGAGTVNMCSSGGSSLACQSCGCCSTQVTELECPPSTSTVNNGTPPVGYSGTLTCDGCRTTDPTKCDCKLRGVACYAVEQPPIVENTSTSSVGTSLGCVAGANYVGKQANNKMTVTATFDDSGCFGVNCLNKTNYIKAVSFWFSPAAPSPNPPITSDLYTSAVGYNTQAMDLSQNSFGLLIKKNDVTNQWGTVYVPGRLIQVGTPIWISDGSQVGSGHVIDIKAPGSYTDLVAQKRTIGVRDVSATDNGTKTTVQFTLQFYNDESGLAANTYQQILNGTYKIYAAGYDMAMIVKDVMKTPSKFTYTGVARSIDLVDPVVDSITDTPGTGAQVNLTWTVSDSTSKVARTFGDADIGDGYTTNGSIDDITSGKLNYVLGSGDAGSTMYTSTNHLWIADSNASTYSRTEVIDLKANTNRDIDVGVQPFDKACNTIPPVIHTISSGGTNPPGGNLPWITTKAGIYFSEAGTNLSVLNSATHSFISADSYWDDPFIFYKDQVDYSTELFQSAGASLPSLIHPTTMKGVRLVNTQDRNNRSNYWFDTLTDRFDRQNTLAPTRFTVVDNTTDLIATAGSSSSSLGCLANRYCVIKVAGNLTVQNTFSCDARTLFLVTGTTLLAPDITASADRNGCIFVSKGNTTIGAGLYKSNGSTYPKYDIVEGFIISDAQIRIPVVDTTRPFADGLKINGSLVAFGSGNTNAFYIARKFTDALNVDYPSVAVHFDNRYLNFAPVFFGGDTEGFKREVGFKPF